MSGNRGFALVLTLVVTALMVAVLTELIHQVYVDTSLSRGFRDGQQASLLAESGVDAGVKYLEFRFSGEYTTLIDPLKQEDETGTIEIQAVEESGKINLNILTGDNGVFDPDTHEALKRLGKRLDIPDDVWNALADWRDSDDNQQSGGGAESSYYLTLKPPYRARNGQLKTVGELSLVKGFTPEIIARLKPFVTVYSDQQVQKININTAPAEVLAALSDSLTDDQSMVDRIIAERRLNPFTGSSKIDRIPGIKAVDVTKLDKNLIYKGTIFRIISVSKVKDSARTVEAVVLVPGGKKLSWQEY